VSSWAKGLKKKKCPLMKHLAQRKLLK
jgi:hypothetical protein